MKFGTRHSCRACGGPIGALMVDLGVQPPANAYIKPEHAGREERAYPLRAVVCGVCRLVQVDYDVPPSELFEDYAYFSSYSESWLAHARRYCEMAMGRFGLGRESLVVELASNDGYLLKNFVAAGIPVLGIDPSDTVAAAAESVGVPTIVDFFGLAVAERLAGEGRSADLVCGANVLAHVPEVNDFVGGIARILKPSGTVTIEFPHLLTLMQHVEFDTIYHEHFSYLSLLAVDEIFAKFGLRLYDVDELPTHGGSLRIYAGHEAAPHIETDRLREVRAREVAYGLADLATYRDFGSRVAECRKSMSNFLARAKRDGRTIAAYGAAAKGNTFLNYCGATAADILCVADRNPHKQGKLLPGSHIPIVSPEALLEADPDYVLILPWNLADEIGAQLKAMAGWRAELVTAIPEVHVRR